MIFLFESLNRTEYCNKNAWFHLNLDFSVSPHHIHNSVRYYTYSVDSIAIAIAVNFKIIINTFCKTWIILGVDVCNQHIKNKRLSPKSSRNKPNVLIKIHTSINLVLYPLYHKIESGVSESNRHIVLWASFFTTDFDLWPSAHTSITWNVL